MGTIYKYPLQIADEQQIELPEDARILTVQMQAGKPCLWALNGVETEKVKRIICMFGTGHAFDPEGLSYIGTVQQDRLVWHVFIETDF